MKVNKAPIVIEKGLAIFIEAPSEVSEVRVSIVHSGQDCPTREIASGSCIQSSTYSLFLYEEELAVGGYLISAEAGMKTKKTKGSIFVEITPGETYKVIGSPYSIYPPIRLE